MTTPVDPGPGASYWQREPARLVGQVVALLGLLAAGGLQISDNTTAAITELASAAAVVLAAEITRKRVSSTAATKKLKAAANPQAVMGKSSGLHPMAKMPTLPDSPFASSFDPPETEEDPVISQLIAGLQDVRIRANPGGSHPTYKLGRIVNHDERSRQYALPEPAEGTAYEAKRWTREAPVFDQGQVGSCTGNAAAGWVGTDDSTRLGVAKLPDGTAVDEALALSIYSAAETIDGDGPYPPKDNGSSGLSVAKVLKARGLCSDYSHAFSITAVYAALQKGPGLAGVRWYNSMYTPDADGRIHVDTSSTLEGGHEFVLDELEVDTVGVPTKIWMQNSWGNGWGVGGRGYFTPADLTKLLSLQGDFTVPTPITVKPDPEPTPTPTPVSTDPFAVEVASFPKLGPALARLAKEKGMTVDEYAAWRLAGDTKTR